jgi:hypothetical protein
MRRAVVTRTESWIDSGVMSQEAARSVCDAWESIFSKS